MKFGQLSRNLQKLETASSRLEITALLAHLFHASAPAEIDKIVYLLLGQLAPQYQNIVFNLADRMMLKALAQAYAVDLSQVRALYQTRGDLGNVAEKLNSKSQSGLSVTAVYEQLVKIANLEGEGSQAQKISTMADLLSHLDSLSVRFVARIPVGKLRLGFSDKTIIDALSWYLQGDKSLSPEIEKIYQIHPDVGQLAKSIKQRGFELTQKSTSVEIGVPVLPMLAQRLKSPAEMIEKMGQVAIEPKFDGLRVQIHYQAKTDSSPGQSEPVEPNIRAFTRNLNEISYMFPELQQLSKYLACRTVILDSEAVGLDPQTQKMVNFQRTMKRRRKHAVRQTTADIPLRFQLFDLLYKNGQSYLKKPYLIRRKILEKTVRPNNFFVVDQSTLTDAADQIRAKHRQFLAHGLEGAMLKKATSHYVPGRTGFRWVKLKEVEEASGKLADTVDVVIIGFSKGKGKRARFGLGQFLAAIRDHDHFKTITKVGTGLSEDQLVALGKRLKKLAVPQKPAQYLVHKDLTPQYWVIPEVVVELAADELTKSPKHTAGLALRFPRLLCLRPDKSPQETTTLAEIKKLYNMQ